MSLGIVMVSHVSDVVNGIERLINEVAKDVSVTTAGGTEDNGVGTSFEKILTAFEKNEADKILAFYDLGSAKMNLEMAIEMTDKEVTLYDTALLESSYTAAALIQAGADISAIEEQLLPLKVK
ncbi:dihydroxyacetone kinase phosphoryl donor subunit DhaM [Vagococcus carniphilus]|uniref:phosphoenolpyruvate--glycerone phosphotransferase n=1 Tax=Vagococcus carniphilus TaxID=218144 RepID=A0A430B6D1_9ENTE|nr:dihydroxyacetone kinase phosphoryl donor subunit DhaM [Vagococcus carniphilus]MDT2815681.1 dihydroxyacetone kinase phosphoryl donor subunit DhaM [Vagococcus carniphilus]MDT2831232.1 dihydroxyacetone kinase phosphoryl donor subunit DhaM [Vagococcus carniphilus]MDT2834747.1 dihydroxyacetone kinase phosphoryl donor subunit DhaM [Vagococcus carniphilus]MDT2839609.1 dihydroxyacetone kinase phosphoryl donor subunit DhaM [Vagococcus carniphilus]MDT2850301.1 dihydroxyacetone kinase phosphoryl donor